MSIKQFYSLLIHVHCSSKDNGSPLLEDGREKSLILTNDEVWSQWYWLDTHTHAFPLMRAWKPDKSSEDSLRLLPSRATTEIKPHYTIVPCVIVYTCQMFRGHIIYCTAGYCCVNVGIKSSGPVFRVFRNNDLQGGYKLQHTHICKPLQQSTTEHRQALIERVVNVTRDSRHDL